MPSLLRPKTANPGGYSRPVDARLAIRNFPHARGVYYGRGGHREMAVDAAVADQQGMLAAAAEPSEAEKAAALRERLLLARLRRRDERAFAELVRGHQDRVYDLCVRMLGDREEALDVAQEVFVALHGSIGQFRGDSRLSTWIFKVAKNHCLNRLKYLGRRQRGKTDELSDVPEDELAAHGTEPGPQEALLGKEQQARVQAAIARLPEEQRLLVVLRDIEGLSYDEIVQITDQPEGTVKSRLHRARSALAAILGGREPEDAP
jgi:RNA polymerase sigma-70 factor (ECF subfamily)